MSAPQAEPQLKPVQAAAAGASGLLQRKCACGKAAGGLTGECEDCGRESLSGVQTKLLVGANDDPLEQEADQIAGRVMAMPAAPGTPSLPVSSGARRPPPDQACYGHDIRRMGVRPELPEGADLLQGGSPLAAGLRRFFESRFGRDLSEVRVHTGPRSEAVSDALNAHAFTYGSHVWLGRGHRPAVDFLMAHELAHVIQQRQPKALPGAGRDSASSAPEPLVRRLELGHPFWVPLGAKGMKTGSDIHGELLPLAQASNKNLDVEAPAPNAVLNAHGLGLQGRIDLYQGKNGGGFHAQVGLFFDGPKGAKNADVLTAAPTKHRHASAAGIAAGHFNPFVTATGGIDGIAKGPNEVQIGELKPAAKPLLDKGSEQIKHYQEGMKDAARLTNDWAKSRKTLVTDRWKLNSPGVMPDSAVKFQRNGKELKFNPASPREDETLVLATVRESSSVGAKYVFKVRFNPAAHGLPPIKGGLYAQKFGSGNGLWMYFARPKDLAGALKLARSALIKGEMTEANRVQDQVINPLFEAPKKKAGPKIAKLPLSRQEFGAAPVALRAASPAIRRAPKAPEMTDDFKHGKWKTDQKTLRDELFGPAAKAGTKKKVASLELLERAYEAEEALDKVPGTGKSKLPDKRADVVKIVTGKGTAQETKTRQLADLASWLRGWTGKPAEVLGLFRNTFGDSFVFVANKLADLRDKLRKKFHETFDKHPSKATSGKGKIIAKALLKALLQVAKVLIPRALHLYLDAVVTGSKKKLAKLFDIDPMKLLEDSFGKAFKDWVDKLIQFKKDAEEHVKNTVAKYTKDLAWFQAVIDKSKYIGPILEAAGVAIQCGKKPGWNCLLLLSSKYRQCGMEMALNLCPVQKQVASAVAAVGPLANLPATLAQSALDVSKEAAPDGLKEIFDEKVGASGNFDSNDIDCEDTPLETDCPALIPLPLPLPGTPKPDESKKDEPPQKGPEAERPPEPPPPPKPEEEKPPKAPDERQESQGGDDGGKSAPGGTEPSKKSGKPEEEPGGKPRPEGKEGKAEKPEGGGEQGGTAKGEPEGKKPELKPGEEPEPGQTEGDKPRTGAQHKPESGKPGGAAGQPGGEQPKPEKVHEELSKLLNEQGPEGVGALAELAQAAGMPGDQPLTADQVKKLRELLKRGKLSAQELQDLTGPKPKPEVKKRAKPLEKFLEKEAHRAVMEQTLEKLRQKQYEFKFQEMAKHKVHWKILIPYKPGPFRNAPALMWDTHIRAAGVVDGEFGKCYDGGKIPLTITKADMREEGTEKKVIVHTPFHDKDAQLTGGVCPTPPQPKGGGAGQGQGPQDEGDSGGKAQDGGKVQDGGKDQGKAQEPPVEGKGKPEPSEVDSDVKPGDKGDPKEKEAGGKEQEEAKDKGKPDAEQKPEQAPDAEPEPKEKDEEPDFPLDVATLGKSCGLPPECTLETFLVDFEELGNQEDGWQVMPDKDKDPDGTQSIVNPPNKVAPFTLRTTDSGEQEIVISCQDKTCVVGKVVPSPVSAEMVELVSGSLLDALRALLREYIKAKRGGTTNRAERIHLLSGGRQQGPTE